MWRKETESGLGMLWGITIFVWLFVIIIRYLLIITRSQWRFDARGSRVGGLFTFICKLIFQNFDVMISYKQNKKKQITTERLIFRAYWIHFISWSDKHGMLKNPQPAPHDPHSHSYSLYSTSLFTFILDRAFENFSQTPLYKSCKICLVWLFDSRLSKRFDFFYSKQ